MGRAEDLIGRPSSGQDVGEEGRENVRDGFVQQSDDRHPQNPYLECDEHDIFAFGVVKPA